MSGVEKVVKFGPFPLILPEGGVRRSVGPVLFEVVFHPLGRVFEDFVSRPYRLECFTSILGVILVGVVLACHLSVGLLNV